MLDVGCGEGYWLDCVCQRRSLGECIGVELAENRFEWAHGVFPNLDVRQGSITNLNFPDRTVDAVNCFKVLGYVPDWPHALEELIRLARHMVLITVPYRERIRHELCIHCLRPTPEAGHLHSFARSSFAEFTRHYPLKIVRFTSTRGDWLHRSYYRLVREFAWYVVLITVER